VADVDDETAVHAVLPADVSGVDADYTVCELPAAGHKIKFVATLDRAEDPRVGVDCIVCLGWLGARHADPPVVVKGEWYRFDPPSLRGESAEAFTNRLAGAFGWHLSPYDHLRNRGCAIGWHEDCTDPAGHTCQCPCHRDVARVERVADAEAVREILGDVEAELDRARIKFPGQHLPLGFGTSMDARALPLTAGLMTPATLRDALRTLTDRAADEGHLTWRHVLLEEHFEALAEDDPAKARTELVQLAAMCLRAILDVDRPRPVSYTGPSGTRWAQRGSDAQGRPIVAADVNEPLTPAGVSGPAPPPPVETP
jgi:hypothetical protein